MYQLCALVVLTGVLSQPDDSTRYATTTLGMKFVWIPPGTFTMGSPYQDKSRNANELPHQVTLTRGFYMAVHLVTQEQWQAVMGHNPSFFRGEANLPVERITWHQCHDFMKILREKDKIAYRLPTEAEWEYACRAGTRTAFSCGDSLTPAQANLADGSPYQKNANRGKTTPVGSFAANPWGLFDMHGNLLEWCEDWYGEYPQGAVVDPHGPAAGQYRVLRGGSWYHFAQGCRSAFRSKEDPGLPSTTRGFRLCFSVEKQVDP